MTQIIEQTNEKTLRTLVTRLVTNMSMLMERTGLGQTFGQQYQTKRDIPEAAGYKKERIFVDYSAKYTYQDIAHRIVDSYPESTWQESPTLLDGKKNNTEFIKTWNELITFGSNPADIQDQKTIWHYLLRSDKLSGVGRYGALVVGINDGERSFTEPLKRGGASRVEDFLYLAPYDEANIEVTSLGKDAFNRRYNLPEFYTLTGNSDIVDLQGEEAKEASEPIHWTRVIHIAEGLQNNEIFGTPRLEFVFNLLDDLLKVTAATGESAWQMMSKGLITSAKENFNLPTEATQIAETTEALENFVHGLTRVLELQNMDAELTTGDIVDPTGVVKSIVALISAATGIPQRILLGSEAGHLASDQDEKTWSQRIMSRQVNFAEAIILRPLISRLIYSGILPPPESGNYTVEWPSQLILTPLEAADKVQKEMAAMQSAVHPDLLPLVSFLKIELGYSDEEVKMVLRDKQIEEALSMFDFPADPL
jgi:hypothetical protein